MPFLRSLQDRYFRFRHPIAERIRKKKLTYLSIAALQNIYMHIKSVEQQNIPGIFIEAGCALGGSTIMIAYAKSSTRMLKAYDVFGMIPPPSDRDGDDVHARFETIQSGKSKGIGGDQYYGYKEDLLNQVTQHLKDFGFSEVDNIQLIKGLYEDTLHVDQPVAFAHLDCDWYSSTMICLKNIEPRLSPGGIIIIDDYYTWSGCKTAVDEYFSASRLVEFYRISTAAQKLIIRKVH